HPVGSRDACHRRAFGQRLFDDSPFLCDAPPLPLDRTRQLTLRRVLSWNLSGSVHLCSKWTPILSVHFGEWLSFRWLSRRSQPDAYLRSTDPSGYEQWLCPLVDRRVPRYGRFCFGRRLRLAQSQTTRGSLLNLQQLVLLGLPRKCADLCYTPPLSEPSSGNCSRLGSGCRNACSRT